MPWSLKVERELITWSNYFHVPIVAGGAITHHKRENFPAQDILACAHYLAEVEDPIGRKLFRADCQATCSSFPRRALNAERTLKNERELLNLFHDHTEWLVEAENIADQCEKIILPARPKLPALYNDDAKALGKTQKRKHKLCAPRQIF